MWPSCEICPIKTQTWFLLIPSTFILNATQSSKLLRTLRRNRRDILFASVNFSHQTRIKGFTYLHQSGLQTAIPKPTKKKYLKIRATRNVIRIDQNLPPSLSRVKQTQSPTILLRGPRILWVPYTFDNQSCMQLAAVIFY